MKKLNGVPVLLSALLILIILASCQPGAAPALTPSVPAPVPRESPTPTPAAATPTPTPERILSPSPTPSPTPNAAEVLRRLGFDIPAVSEQMLSLTAKYRLVATNATGMATRHAFTVSIGGKLWQLTWRADGFIKLGEYLRAANSLTATGKLENEVRPRDISKEELLQQILLACKQASDALEAQLKDSYGSQDYFYQWIKEDTLVEGHYSVKPTAEERERAIVELNRYYDRYRADLTELKVKLDAIITANIDYARKKAA